MGLLESVFGDRKTRSKRRRKRVVRSAGDAAGDTVEGCTGGCCLDVPLVLAVGGLAGRRVLRARRR